MNKGHKKWVRVVWGIAVVMVAIGMISLLVLPLFLYGI